MNPHPKNILPLGDFKPSDQWQTHVNAIFYGIQGPGIHNHFQTYVSQDYRLAHALAEEYYRLARDSSYPSGKTRFIHEWGVGNGNLAACFLTHLREIDTEGHVYPAVHYLLCDYSLEILKGARANPRLKEHAGKFSTVQIDASHMDCFKEGSADKILSNEIWDDMATRVIVKQQGLLYEEYLQPLIDPAVVGIGFEEFVKHFSGKNLSELAKCPPFLQAIAWERSFQRTDISDWPFAETLQAQAERLADDTPVPVNTGAFSTLERARKILHPQSQGYTGMDYGMFSIDDLNQEERPYFNLYGGQYTFMVNFDLLEEAGKSLGFKNVRKEYQHRYVGRFQGEKVASVVEIVQGHPEVPRMEPWDRDILMIQTLQNLNSAYKSPYKNKMEYPVMPGTPKKQRKQIAKLAGNLSPYGVPDTVAYVTQSEVSSAAARLRRLGYREKGLQRVFEAPPQPVSFVCLTFQ